MNRYKIGMIIVWVFAVISTVLLVSCGKETVSEVSVSKTPATVSKIKSTAAVITDEPEPDYNYVLTLTRLFNAVDQLESLVEGYNRLHPDKAVKLNSMLDNLDTSADLNGGLASLAEQIAAGKGPDLMYLSSYMLKNYYEEGLLMPLNEAASAYIQEEVIPGVVECGTVDGTFVGLAPSISIYSIVVPTSIYSEKTWTVRDVLKCMEDHPELSRTFVIETDVTSVGGGIGEMPTPAHIYFEPQAIIWPYRFELSEQPFMDEESKKADFYNEDVVRLLENMHRDKESLIRCNEYRKTEGYLGKIVNLEDLPKLVAEVNHCCSEYNFVGYPVEQGTGNIMYLSNFICVSKNTSNLEAVSEFLDYVISPEGQLSMNRGYMRYTTTPHEIPVRKDIVNYLTEYPEFKIQDPDRFAQVYEELLDSCRYRSYEGPVSMILEEEITPYLESMEDPNTVAKRIQDRVQEYLDTGEYTPKETTTD